MPPCNSDTQTMKQQLITALAATIGLAVGSIATTAFTATGQPKGVSSIESLKVGGIVNVDEFEHDGTYSKCTTDVTLTQSINMDESLTGSLEVRYKNAAEPEPSFAYGYVKDGKGFVAVTAYDYGKKSCDFETAQDYAINEILYATVTPQPLFVAGEKD